jgi:deazaflavin-dependent oxidoreductase (nitroreductase family)
VSTRQHAVHPPLHRRPAAGPPRWVNRIVAGALRSPLHPLLGRALALVTVTGRRTGRPITVPVMCAQGGEDLVVLVGRAAQKSWWRNLAECADVTVTLGGRRQPMRATVLAHEPERGEALRVYLERFPKARHRLTDTDVLVRLSHDDQPEGGPNEHLDPGAGRDGATGEAGPGGSDPGQVP